MMTRGIMDQKGEISMFELSSPGIRGQSGGPLFDEKGIIYGMQTQTKHLDLAFDIDMPVIREGEIKKANAYSFLHLGVAICSSQIRKFLDDNNVFYKK